MSAGAHYRGDRTWGAALKAAMVEAGIGVSRLAERVFVNETSVRDWLRGKTTPSRESLGRLLEVFPALPAISTDVGEKPSGGDGGGRHFGEAGAVWKALAAVGAEARSYAVRHVDVLDPVLGAGQILGREVGRALVLFGNQIKWLGDDQVASIRVEA